MKVKDYYNQDREEQEIFIKYLFTKPDAINRHHLPIALIHTLEHYEINRFKYAFQFVKDDIIKLEPTDARAIFNRCVENEFLEEAQILQNHYHILQKEAQYQPRGLKITNGFLTFVNRNEQDFNRHDKIFNYKEQLLDEYYINSYLYFINNTNKKAVEFLTSYSIEPSPELVIYALATAIKSQRNETIELICDNDRLRIPLLQHHKLFEFLNEPLQYLDEKKMIRSIFLKIELQHDLNHKAEKNKVKI